MALTTGIYYHDLGTHYGYLYRLLFVPGSTADLTADDINIDNYIQLPHDFIKSAKITRNFDNDMPVGQELQQVLELEFNLNSLYANTDFSAFLSYLLATQSAGTVTAWYDYESANVTYHIPNVWYVQRTNDGWATYDILFLGCQERVKQYTFDATGTHKINVCDMASTLLRNISIKQVGDKLHLDLHETAAQCQDELVYWAYDDGNIWTFISNSSTDWGSNHNRLK